MQEFFEYKCPSCGANLKPAAEGEVITCSFCGSAFERTGEHDHVSAAKLAQAAEKYKADLAAHQALETKVLQLADEVTYLSQQPTQLPIWASLLIPLQAAGIGVSLLLFWGSQRTDSKALLILSIAAFSACIIALLAANIKKQRLLRESGNVKNKLKAKLSELTAARNELEQFEQSFDIDAIPKEYRNDAALDYVIGLFKSGQAGRLSEAFKRYDEHSHYKNMEALQREQVAIQKRQLEIMDELADYDFDDTYDDDDFRLHDTLKAFHNNDT